MRSPKFAGPPPKLFRVDKYVGAIAIPQDDGEIIDTAGRTLIQVAHVVVRLEDRGLSRNFGLSYRQMRILKHIAAGVRSGTELGRIFGVTAPAISETLESLVKKGLVVRTPHESDRRAVKLRLTPEGAALNTLAGASERELARELLNMLDESEIEQLLGLVSKVLVPNQERLINHRLNND